MLTGNFPLEGALVEIQLVALIDDDLENIAAVGLVGDDLRSDALNLEEYQLVEAMQDDNESRGESGLFQLIPTLMQNLQDHQAFIQIFTGAGLTALGLLLKQRRVKKVEITVGEKTLIIQNADQSFVEKSMKEFQVLCNENDTKLLKGSSIKMKASVSAKKHKK